MQAARRLYLYVMSGITLGVISLGFVLLVQSLLEGLFPGSRFGEVRNAREQLSQAVAMLGVGVPVWLVHWRLIQRGLRPDRPERDAERGDGIRAIYISLVLGIALVIWVNSGITLIQWAITTAFLAVPEYTYQNPAASLATGATGLGVWLYHGLVRRRDLAAGPVEGPAAWIPRLYLYGASLGGLVAAVSALDSLVSWVLIAPDSGGNRASATFYATQQFVTAVAWAIVWFAHWRYADRLVRDPSWRGVEEGPSRMRVGAFVVAIVVAAGSTLTGVASAIGALLARLFPEPGLGFPMEDGLTVAVASLLRALPWALIWFGFRGALRREPAASEPERALHQERLVSHGVAAVALAIGASGVGWMLGYLIDALLGGERSAGGIGSQMYEIRQWLPWSIVGLAAWAWTWRSVVGRRRRDPVGEAQSTIRRAFLYLTIAVALVAAISSAALILYRFVGIVLGATIGGDLVTNLSTPLGYLLTAGAVIAYHGLQLRADTDLAGDVQREGTAESAATDGSPEIAPARARRAVELVGPPGADLDAALAAARAALPAGIEIVAPHD